MAGGVLSDLGRTNWLATLKVALARGFFSGIIWSVAMLATGSLTPLLALAYIVAWPFAVVPLSICMSFIARPLSWLADVLGENIAGTVVGVTAGCLAIIGSALVAPGDPFVYLVNRQFPRLLDVVDFKFFNFQPLILILNPE